MTSSNPLVLLIEDDTPLRKYLRTLLSGAGYSLEEAETGEQGIRLASRMMPAVVILDLGLPDVDGQDVLRALREKLQVPIVVLSGREQPIDKIEALDHGADDYLTKPFSTGELLARIRVALRHAALGQRAGESPLFEFGDLQVDLFARRVFVRNSEVHLTPLNTNCLRRLLGTPAKFSRMAFCCVSCGEPNRWRIRSTFACSWLACAARLKLIRRGRVIC